MSRHTRLEARRKNWPRRLSDIMVLAVGAAGLAGCTVAGVPGGAESSAPDRADEVSDRSRGCQEVCASGTLTIIWNGEPRYFLFDEQGQQRQLLVSEEVARAAGGPLRLNNKRVIVVGDWAADPPGSIRVRSIQIREERQPSR